ncbi:MAG: 16S rRNA (guanine(966)-N(2))-methyltransferase RsmD [Acetobacteraceae bacterium]
MSRPPGPRIIAGAWRGRKLVAPPGLATRPTAERVRQALFDMLWHAPWGGRGLIEGARVLDGFAGTGALGIEALSRGAAEVVFLEQDAAALAALAGNLASLGAGERARVLAGDVLAARPGSRRDLAMLDPPYGMGLPAVAVARLRAGGWIGPGTVVVVETGRDEALALPPDAVPLAERAHGAARLAVWRIEADAAAG